MGNYGIFFFNIAAVQNGKPGLFGGLHIFASLLSVALAVIIAVLFARRLSSEGASLNTLHALTADGSPLVRILTVCGVILAALEIFKQLYLYFAVNDRIFDWWFFPFQLCSIPMYLCVLLPFAARPFRRTFFTFMGGYTFVSAVAALIYPEDILRSDAVLAAHGFIWHGILLFISILILLVNAADTSAKGIARAAGLFAFLCLIAVAFNMAAGPQIERSLALHPDLPHTHAAMFYLDPYHLSVQPLVGSIQKAAGIPAGLILYSLAIAAVSSAVILLSGKIRLSDPDPDDPDL